MEVQGLARAKSERPSAVLLDLNMPGEGGFTVLARLKADETTRDIPVIVVISKVLTSADEGLLLDAAEIRRALLSVGLEDRAAHAPPGA